MATTDMMQNLITFPVATTNIFPLSNSAQGGQLVTEYNLKSREMVATNPHVKYAIGPSFLHSLDDFKVGLLSSGGTSISTSILQVNPGRAVINGHFIESLSPVTIDLSVVNAERTQNAKPALYGNLSIGLKAYFSTESTMAGSMLVENTDNMYVGIQVVIAPTSEFKTPNDEECYTSSDNAIADIKLADFTYVNGVISESSIAINQDATRYIPSARIYDFDSILDDKYVTSDNLVDKFFYTFSGKSKDWCNSTDSLMIWDAQPTEVYVDTEHGEEFSTVGEAQFIIDDIGKGAVHLVVPHKQQDGIVRENDKRLYYADKDIPLPTANFDAETSGIVTAAYTKRLKNVENTLNSYKEFTNGKQVTYWETLKRVSEDTYNHTFPETTDLNIGDYILVREDYTLSSSSAVEGSAPSTMYFVLPGNVTLISTTPVTEKPTGILLGNLKTFWAGTDPNPAEWTPTTEELKNIFGYTTYNGVVGDYFEIEYRDETDDSGIAYYYPVTDSNNTYWSGAVRITGGTFLATNEQVGGFYNTPTDDAYADAGYVYLDNTGHLKLMDYPLLRSGTLAYQLGEDYQVPSSATLEFVMKYLDEKVNARVAFPFGMIPSSTPAMINVTIPLPKDSNGIINIYNIDSRFGTGVYLHFLAEDKSSDYSNIVINISDCEKIRIDSSVTTLSNGPIINVFRSCLYYDAEVINYIRICDNLGKREDLFPSYTNFTGFEDFTIWYDRFLTSDPDLQVNGMEISQPNVSMIPEEISFWDENINNDNHYQYALRSITLSGSGKIIACSLYVASPSTQTVNTTQHIIIGGKFKLPQGSALNYPMACINSPLQITGSFVSAYQDSTHTKWITTETTFTARSGVYSVGTGLEDGSIAFDSKTDLIDATYTHVSSISGWEPGAFHIFYGGTTI